MKKRKNIILLLIIIPIISLVVLFKNNNYNETINIETVLNNKYYSYLPEEAKEYIKGIYEETGELILTEKNKQENIPYLNPEYVEYLAYSDEEKNQIDIIPAETVIDFVSSDEVVTDTLPSKYNLSELDLDGDGVAETNYTTPMKNQKSLGLCWAYTTVEIAETNIMLTNNETYDADKTEVLSVRQLDYVSSTNGIKNYTNSYGTHSLGGGGSFNYATKTLSLGISLASSSWKYDSSYEYDQIELNEVLNDNDSLYELDSTIEMPILNIKSLDLTEESNLDKYNQYISTIKEYIKSYGGAYVSTQAPGYSCSARNVLDTNTTNKRYIIDVDSTCTKDASHAMQIIGWDDDYTYKYCINGTKHTTWTSSCTEENTVTGTGAWILRNSWGDSAGFKITYLAYDATNAKYSFISSLSKNTNREWNYVYNQSDSNLKVTYKNNTGSLKYQYTVKIVQDDDIDSELIKIKFKNATQNNKYNIYYSESGSDDDYILLEASTVNYPGIVTVNVSNVKFNKSSKIKIETNYVLTGGYFSVFTNEVSNNSYIKTSDLEYEETTDNLAYEKDETKYYNINLSSNIYNIETGEKLIYEIYDQSGNNITSNITVNNNSVSFNKINTSLTIPSAGNNEYYTVKILYNDEIKSISKIIPTNSKKLNGSGTESDPYIITTPEELYSINNNMEAYYVLGNDIDMTYDTQNEFGLYYNDGDGWTSIGYENALEFTGSLNGYYNGEYHKIIGLKTSSYGLFYYIYPSKNNVNIKNIIFEDAIITGISNEGLLAYEIDGGVNYTTTIENIAAINCQFSGSSNMLATFLVSYQKDGLTINNIFNDSSFNDTGIISSIAWKAESKETYTTDSSIKISNVELLGKVNNKSSSYISLIRYVTGNVSINNILYNNYTNTTPYLFGTLSKSSSDYQPSINNVYYLGTTIFNLSTSYYDKANVTSKTLSELKDKESYANWEDFDTYWTFNNSDSTHIPILKFISFEYTTFKDIELKVNETVSIYDYITPTKEAAKNINFGTSENGKVTIDSSGNIKGLSAGTDTIHIVSNYDGTEKDIIITILEEKSTITFDSNGGEGTMDDLVVVNNLSTNLTKNTFTKTGYTFKEWNTKADGSGNKYTDEEEVSFNLSTTLYAIWTPITYKIIFNANGGTGTSYEEIFTYDTKQNLPKNLFTKTDYTFTKWNTLQDGTGTSYNSQASILNLLTNQDDTLILYAIWEKNKLITNNTIDYEGIYDGLEHSININVEQSNYSIKYSINNTNYDLTELPKFKDIGEYTINYIISIDGYIDLIGSNKVKIYGIKSFDNSITLKDNVLLTSDTSFEKISNKITTYSTSSIFNHYNSNNQLVSSDLIKTGDIINIKLNNTKNYEYQIALLGDTNGDGKINYLDYVNVYNHIQKEKHSELNKKLLENVYLLAADISGDGKINYLDYVNIYKKIKELKGGEN